jgi:two-component system, OmpR family, phosphate regulon sensor histidine kinase PhoR
VKRSVIILVIALMTVALAGIVVLQATYIRQQVALKEKQFDAGVMEALNDVTALLENREAAKIIAWNNLRNSHDSTLSSTILSLDSLRNIERAVKIPKFKIKVPDVNYSFHFNDDTLVFTDSYNFNQVFPKDWEKSYQALHELRIINSDEQLKNMEVRLRNKEKQFDVIVKKMVREAAALKDSGNQRLQKAQVEKTLRESFKNRGITIPYNYAVINSERDSVLVTDDTASSMKAMASPYVTELFPNDIIPLHHKLAVWFPEKPSFIFSGSNTGLFGSFVFILVVIVCFGYTLLTLIRQKKLSDMKSDFINNMTHELKTPLATISVAADALHDVSVPGGNTEQIKYYTGIIKQENSRINAQVERVLQIARLDKHDLQLNKEPVNLHSLISSAAEVASMQVEKRGGKITTMLQAEKPTLSVDPLHITNVIQNLIDNANKYSPSNPDITVKTQSDENGIFISVTDKGIGMNNETLGRIFDKFFRASSGNIHDVKGFGLGLSYTKAIVEMHSGTIRVQSKEGEGSMFTVYLPYESSKQ